ncbi:MAG: hypothetical protein AAB955_02615, partial [Patescibacteria group bacterium]
KSAYRINMAAAEDAKLIPKFDVDEVEEIHKRTVGLYNGVTYGEVLIKDKNANLIEVKLTDLIKLGNTSDKVSPALAHRFVEILQNTNSGASGWQLNSGAFEHPKAHGGGSEHIRSPQMLNCIDIRPTLDKGMDPRRLGEFLLAAQKSGDISFFQLETGPDYTVDQMKAALVKEWGGKATPDELKYMLSKVHAGGSGIHFHTEFKGPAFHTAYPDTRAA